MRTIKEEVIWLNGFSSFSDARQKIGGSSSIDYSLIGNPLSLFRHSLERSRSSFPFVSGLKTEGMRMPEGFEYRSCSN